jgi:hypothetical protein
MAITTIWQVITHLEDKVNFRFPLGAKGYVFHGSNHLLAPYSADLRGNQIISVPLLIANINTIEEKAREGGERLTSKNWFGFNIADGIMNLVTWYETPGSLVKYGMIYTNTEVFPQFQAMIREPEKPFEWGTQAPPVRRVSRYERGWVI